ncbi:MAG: DUF1365 domain-containing protein [Alphaproteobacteria bacterium]|nr:DUF1365 domain-containing protein [Alphaproteobacteria bacterium]
MLEPGLLFGHVAHARLRPKRHALRRPMISVCIDLDRPDATRARLFSIDRFNLLSLRARDHGPRDGSALRPWVERQLRAVGHDEPPARILLVALPRVLFYVFNPISLYLCLDRDNNMRAILYEVHNTFGEAHVYVAPRGEGAPDGVLRHAAPKAFHVSPFISMTARYHFALRLRADALSLVIREDEGGAPLLVATQQAAREPMSDRAILRAFARTPLFGLGVILSIHLHALRLWLKGVALQRHPGRPAATITLAHTEPAPHMGLSD